MRRQLMMVLTQVHRLRREGARKAQADGEAYANLSIAKAQAEALRVQNAALPTAIYSGAPIPFLNVGK